LNNVLYTKCRIRFNYSSLIKLNLLLGFCAGLLSIPVLFLLNAGSGTLSIVTVIVGAPISGAAGGLLVVILGYPLYSWFTSRTNGQEYAGTFQVKAEQNEQ